jgi:NADH-quinone oxidoreductase subunit G
LIRVTARKNKFGEVEEFICNECRFDHKEKSQWTIEGPRKMDVDSVITANKYELPVVSPAVNVDAKFVSE